MDLDKLTGNKAARMERWLGLTLAIGFSALMIYLDTHGVNTATAFHKLLGFIVIAVVALAVVAVFILLIARIWALLSGGRR